STFAMGRALRGEAQYPSATPRSANGTAPSASAAASAAQRSGESEASVVATATVATRPAEARPKTAPEATRAASRVLSRIGSVLRKRSHGDSRSAAIPTPNWKKATPRTANPANDASRSVGSASVSDRGATKSRKKSAGKASVGTLKVG